MCSLTKGIFIVAAKRTPIGTLGGKLSSKSLTDLSEVASKAALQSGSVDPSIVDSVVIGNVRTVSSSDGAYLARHVLLRCGIPLDRPAYSINRMCGSGFQAIVNGAHEILIGDSQIVLTGGSECMSGAPFLIRGARSGIRLGAQQKLDDSLWQGFMDLGCGMMMGMTAENLASKYKIGREETDAFALESQRRWANAHAKGYFKQEIAPVQAKVKGTTVEMDTDEHPKPGTTLEALAKLRPVFKPDGIVTAGNASGINDGAGAVVIASEDATTRHGLKPLARLVAYSIVGVDPTIMGIGPVPAIRNLLQKTGLTLNDIDLVEINEAFGPQLLACQRELQIDPERLNVNGGAIAIGHPVGASGARIMTHLTYELKRRGARYGIGSACIGGGQGIALLIEAL